MKKVMSVLALCGLLALSGGSAFAAQWKLAHIRPADSVMAPASLGTTPSCRKRCLSALWK